MKPTAEPKYCAKFSGNHSGLFPLWSGGLRLFGSTLKTSLASLAICVSCLLCALSANGAPVVAAASSMRTVLPEIVAAFSAETNLTADTVFGSSGNLARQISQGAPFEVFLSADEGFIKDLERAGLATDHGLLFATGRLVYYISDNSTLNATDGLPGLQKTVSENQTGRLSIANPEHAPYGRRAKEVLAYAGLWEDIEEHLVYGENVAQAAQFVASGNADAGLIPYSLALNPDIRAKGDFTLIPADWHSPLNHHVVLLKPAGEDAQKFLKFILSQKAQEILNRHGFTTPEQ